MGWNFTAPLSLLFGVGSFRWVDTSVQDSQQVVRPPSAGVFATADAGTGARAPADSVSEKVTCPGKVRPKMGAFPVLGGWRPPVMGPIFADCPGARVRPSDSWCAAGALPEALSRAASTGSSRTADAAFAVP